MVPLAGPALPFVSCNLAAEPASAGAALWGLSLPASSLRTVVLTLDTVHGARAVCVRARGHPCACGVDVLPSVGDSKA